MLSRLVPNGHCRSWSAQVSWIASFAAK